MVKDILLVEGILYCTMLDFGVAPFLLSIIQLSFSVAEQFLVKIFSYDDLSKDLVDYNSPIRRSW